MPAQNRVWCHDAGDVGEAPSTDGDLRQNRIALNFGFSASGRGIRGVGRVAGATSTVASADDSGDKLVPTSQKETTNAFFWFLRNTLSRTIIAECCST